MKNLKLTLSLCIVIMMTLTSCMKDELLGPKNELLSRCLVVESFDLNAGQNTVMGRIDVVNDDNFVYVSYHCNQDWFLDETHLYVGNADAIPVNKKGNPKIGNFPFNDAHQGVSSFGYIIPIDPNWDACVVVAAHAAVSKTDGQGTVIQSETAWSSGSRINADKGSWATKTDYCVEPCIGS